ncbi:hypothetical protein [uncultured Lutibacter sp.]|uniref:hypothetical protein n=1 Tax=uncultured Lutibacter sp. TaxID=437739 RepID=UPI002604A7B5|nr:hypothetical protein [uncultured Lutibacter sp.]
MSYRRFTSSQFLFGCEFYKNNRNCPFNKLRKLAIEERIHHLKKMTFQELDELDFFHENCKKTRKLQQIR